MFGATYFVHEIYVMGENKKPKAPSRYY